MFPSFAFDYCILGVKIISVRLGVELKKISREMNCRRLSLKTKKSVLLQDKFSYFNYLWVLDDHYAALKLAFDKLFTGIIVE